MLMVSCCVACLSWQWVVSELDPLALSHKPLSPMTAPGADPFADRDPLLTVGVGRWPLRMHSE
jgi:hypothetical protein